MKSIILSALFTLSILAPSIADAYLVAPGAPAGSPCKLDNGTEGVSKWSEGARQWSCQVRVVPKDKMKAK